MLAAPRHRGGVPPLSQKEGYHPLSSPPASNPEATFAENTKVYAYVGSITSLWALLERAIDTQCWRLAGVDDDVGACFTAQLPSARAKMLTLEALAKHKGADANLLKSLKRFRDTEIQTIGEKRNRAVHDPIYIRNNETELTIETLVITTRGLSKLSATPSIQQMRETLFSIKGAYDKFREFWPVLEKLYPSSAGTHP